ncbi:MAG TPA: tRNA epoxyqueuosine(34) reductase QueG [Planctomycetaceae bacterium]|nr:tRNA epoxyqueuosine(34) reductase QueG [Planctomycetaceae bacterium]
MTESRTPPPDLVPSLRKQARSLGFDLFGIAPAVSPLGFHRLIQWVDAGYAAEMNYFADRIDAYGDPGKVLDGAASIIVLTYPYPYSDDASPPPASRPSARIARYARIAADYHDVIHPLLKQLKQTIFQACPAALSRGVVDTAPLMEREFASLAGLGWAGKNSLLLNKNRGSYFFLASILTTLVLPYDQPQETAHCGTCTRCLDACPTDAFAAPGVVDSRRCISYLTIEHRGPIPLQFRTSIGDRLFGCDICQEVCPWNDRAERLKKLGSDANESADPAGRIDLIDLLSMDDAAFRVAFRHTPMWRPRRRGLLRNAAICAGNAKDQRSAEVLCRLLSDAEPLIRGAAAWALGQLGGRQDALAKQLAVELDSEVRKEIESALGLSN